jgi:hypothetical protein
MKLSAGKILNRKVDGLNVKAGPTESGTVNPSPNPHPVGGHIAPIDQFSVFLSQYGILLLLLVIPLVLILYRKRSTVFRTFSRVQMALQRIFPKQ